MSVLMELSTGIVHTCGCETVRETFLVDNTLVDVGVGHVIGDPVELLVTPLLPAAKCSGGCYCVKDRFAWRCVVCHCLC